MFVYAVQIISYHLYSGHLIWDDLLDLILDEAHSWL